MTRNKKRRLYRKDGRFYLDARDYADVGGRQEALIPPGERHATTDRTRARRLARARLADLRAARRRPATEPGVDLTRLGDFVDHHLEREALETTRSKASLSILEHQLEVAVDHFGADTRLRDIRTVDIRAYLDVLARGLGPETVRKYLFALSKLLRRARGDEVVPAEYDPIGVLVNKPGRRRRGERRWLEVPEAALLLEAARLFAPRREDLGVPFAYPLLAALLLTGGRPSEVLQLEVLDVDFVRETVKFRWREDFRLKNESSIRVIPLWPQLAAILKDYLSGPSAPTGRFLFPSPKTPDRPIRNVKKLIEELGRRTGLQGITPKVFRHTYCAARLQTTDNGREIAQFTVAAELGHNSSQMVGDVYGHVGRVRHRSEVVEYPLEPYMLQLKTRLDRLAQLSADRNTHGPCLANRVELEVELAVLRHAAAEPATGPRKVAEKLRRQGLTVSASGVRWILKRHDLNRAEYREEALRTGRLEKVLTEVRQTRSA